MFMKYETWKTLTVYFFVFLFVYTAGSKWMDYARFKWVLEDSPLLKSFSTVIAIGLPAGELVIALLLLLPRSRQTGLLYTVIMMGIFTTYIGYMLLTASSLPCSCGGVLRSMSWLQHFFFNLFLFLLALWAYRVHHQHTNIIAQYRK